MAKLLCSGNGSSSWLWQQCEITQASGPCASDSFETKINMLRLRHTVENYYYDKFQVMPIRSFHFIVLKYTHTHTHTYCGKVIAISSPPCYTSLTLTTTLDQPMFHIIKHNKVKNYKMTTDNSVNNTAYVQKIHRDTKCKERSRDPL